VTAESHSAEAVARDLTPRVFRSARDLAVRSTRSPRRRDDP
jgi:hypothetical protein